MTAISMELEASLEAFFRKRIRLVGGYCIKLAPVEAGTPDRLVLFPGGRMYLVELKTELGVVSPIQRVWHQRVAALGIPVYVLRGRGEILDWVRSAVEVGGPQSNRRGPGPRA